MLVVGVGWFGLFGVGSGGGRVWRRVYLGEGEEQKEHTLSSAFVYAEAFEVDVPPGTELRLDGAGDVDGTLEAEIGHALFDDAEVDGDDAGHLDGAAEGDLAITL